MDLNKTLINPDVSFLTDTALGIAEMLDNLPSGTTDGDKKEEDLEKGEKMTTKTKSQILRNYKEFLNM